MNALFDLFILRVTGPHSRQSILTCIWKKNDYLFYKKVAEFSYLIWNEKFTIYRIKSIKILRLQIIFAKILGKNSFFQLLLQLVLEFVQFPPRLWQLLAVHMCLLDELVVQVNIQQFGMFLIPIGLALFLIQLMLQLVSFSRQSDAFLAGIKIVIIDRIVPQFLVYNSSNTYLPCCHFISTFFGRIVY